MKKLTLAAAVALALAGALAGCHRNDNATSSSSAANTPSSPPATSTAANTPSTPPAASDTAANTTPPSGGPGATNGQDLAAANAVGGNPMASSGTTAAPASGGDTASGATTTMGANAAGGKGQQVFSQTCVACHGTGVLGAPKLGDKADWGPRIAQGINVLYTHALQGFTGKKGTMPPKGGNAALPDADVKAAVDYMVSQGK